MMLRLPTDDQPTNDEQDAGADDAAVQSDDLAPDATTDTALGGPPSVTAAETSEETAVDTGQADDVSDDASDDTESDGNTETFGRTYVERLRRENATYRERARTAEHYAARLHTELVRATGRLADPSDLPFDADHLDDADTLTTALDDLLTRKPHLASRRVFGDVGQGNRGGSVEPVSLADLLRSRA